jgi:hypothetical protein
MQAEQVIQYALIFTQVGRGFRICPARKAMQLHEQWAGGPELQADTLQAVTGEAGAKPGQLGCRYSKGLQDAQELASCGLTLL